MVQVFILNQHILKFGLTNNLVGSVVQTQGFLDGREIPHRQIIVRKFLEISLLILFGTSLSLSPSCVVKAIPWGDVVNITILFASSCDGLSEHDLPPQAEIEWC